MLVAMGRSAYTAGRWNEAVDAATLKALPVPVRERAARMPAPGCDDCLFVAHSSRPNYVTNGDIAVAERAVERQIEDAREDAYEAKRRQEQAGALGTAAATN